MFQKFTLGNGAIGIQESTPIAEEPVDIVKDSGSSVQPRAWGSDYRSNTISLPTTKSPASVLLHSESAQHMEITNGLPHQPQKRC